MAANTAHIVKTAIATELGIPVEDMNTNQLLAEIPDFDSLTFVEIVMNLEEEFDTLLPDHDLEHIATVQDLIDLCDSKIS